MQPNRRIPDVLPPARVEALPPGAAEFRTLGRRRLALLSGQLAGEPVVAVFKTGTALDTGSWFGKGRVWLAFTPTAMLLVARGPRPLCRRAPFAELRQTQYNTVIGELVFVPAELPAPTVALPPVEAAQALAQMRIGDRLC